MGHPPVVALLTDFGVRDHYVGAMKGVVLGICQAASIVDITHEIPPQDILSGAFELAAAVRHFPARTVFVAVVDPGVGSARLAIAAEADGRFFVGPDNGLFSLVFDATPPGVVVELSERRFALPEISHTFEGRDRFAPAGAWLAAGTPIADLGRPVASWVRLGVPVPRFTERTVDGEVLRTLDGEVLRVDRFGNLLTNIRASQVPVQASRVDIAGRSIAGLVRTYADVPEGALCALVGSTGLLEVAVRGGNAARMLAAGRGTPLRVLERA